MITRVFTNYEMLSVAAAKMVAETIKVKPDALLCFPAGETSLGTFKELVRMHVSGEADFSKCKIVGLDEWVNIGSMHTENCYNFLYKNLFRHLGINESQLCFFNGESVNLPTEIKKTDLFIQTNGPVDIMLLGVGMNGHLGLNEPGTDPDSYSIVVELDEVTKKVGQKYFSKPVDVRKGITLGMKHIMQSKTVIVQLSGARKAPIVKRLIESEPTMDFPVSMIKNHPDSYLLIDQDASE
jgi:glucosamine-6-phosphate isomerase